MKHFNKTLLALIISGSCVSHIAQAEVSISGFGSIVAGKTLGTVEDPLKPGTKRDEIFTADFYDVGQYSNDFYFLNLKRCLPCKYQPIWAIN